MFTGWADVLQPSVHDYMSHALQGLNAGTDCCCRPAVLLPEPTCAQLSDLKRTLLDKEQVVQEYAYERSQMQRRIEELSQRLMDKSSSLEGSRSVSFTSTSKHSGANSLLCNPAACSVSMGLAYGTVKCQSGGVLTWSRWVVLFCPAGDPSPQVNHP
jgi:hypothetical protein